MPPPSLPFGIYIDKCIECTLKNELASFGDAIGVQLSIGRRTLFVATRRLKDWVPSENKLAIH